MKLEKYARKKEWHWSRRANGFSDMPIWRVVAAKAGLPLCLVIAFAHRLDELANAAGNVEGMGRGYVGHFDPAEFAVALDISAEEAARTYATLETLSWIEGPHLATFYDRNSDGDGDREANRLRQRRFRARADVRKVLANLAQLGRIDADRRLAIEGRIDAYSDPELFGLLAELRRATLSTGGVSNSVSHRDNVTVTVEKSRGVEHPVDNFGDRARGAEGGLSVQVFGGTEGDPQAAALLWLATDGRAVVAGRLECEPGEAATRIERWLHQELGGNAVALVEVVRAAVATDYRGPRFHNLIVDGYQRARRQAQPQQQLALGPVGLKTAGGGRSP